MGRRPVRPAPYDYVVVSALVAGQRVRGRVAAEDSWEAVRRLAALGFSDGQIAYRIGRTRQQVLRVRKALGVPAPCWRARPTQDQPTVPINRYGARKCKLH